MTLPGDMNEKEPPERKPCYRNAIGSVVTVHRSITTPTLDRRRPSRARGCRRRQPKSLHGPCKDVPEASAATVQPIEGCSGDRIWEESANAAGNYTNPKREGKHRRKRRRVGHGDKRGTSRKEEVNEMYSVMEECLRVVGVASVSS
jgi:hypothetical protein